MQTSSPVLEPLAAAILDFWFGPLNAQGEVAPAKSAAWFAKDPTFDALIRKKYGEYCDLAFMGAFDRWTRSPLGTVPVLLLVDQMPRNIHRGTDRAFAYDKKALALAWAAVHAQVHLQVPTAMGYFVLMPLMHAEHLNVQDLCLTAFGDLLRQAGPELQSLAANGQRYAERHRAIIARFGRFPHRNKLLGRTSTPEEVAFLREPGSSF